MSLFKQSTRRGAAALLFALVLTFSLFSFANDDGRKVKSRVVPAYPEMAKRMSVAGVVKLEVQVSPSGVVKNVKPLGGHPLLIQAAVDAVKQWRYEAGDESTVVVEIKFNNNQ